jgi:hypothetical protein
MAKPRNVIVVKDDVDKVLKSIQALTQTQVLVGIPASSANRSNDELSGEPINNAAIGFISEYGSPAKNIPARPFLLPGIKSAQDKLSRRFEVIASAAIGKKPEDLSDQFYAIGIIAQNAVRMKLTNGPFQPLAESTIAARARRGRKGAKKYLKMIKAGLTPSPDLVKPLIDTGQLRASISFVVRKKEAP